MKIYIESHEVAPYILSQGKFNSQLDTAMQIYMILCAERMDGMCEHLRVQDDYIPSTSERLRHITITWYTSQAGQFNTHSNIMPFRPNSDHKSEIDVKIKSAIATAKKRAGIP